MKARLAWLTMVLALAAACVMVPMSASAAPKQSKNLKSIPVTQTLPDGSTLTGALSITEVGYDEATGFW